jgi:AraC-like DNA-binding protein
VKKSLEAHYVILEEKDNVSNHDIIDFENQNSDFSTKIAQKINENIASSDFGVQDIADYFEISKSTLNRRVKAILGQTTQQLILQARLEKARDLYLQNPKMTQKEIAQKVGMSNTSYLFKKLKETYGKRYNRYD